MANPFIISFGKIPANYVSRSKITHEIFESFTATHPDRQAVILSGARGSGKTVAMTAIAKEFKQHEDWVVIELNPERDLLTGLLSKLYDHYPLQSIFAELKLNLSAFGIVDTTISSRPPVADIETALSHVLGSMKKHEKKLLICIDEISNNEYMRVFASAYQILIRNDHPVYLIMTGLFENIRSLENDKALTFLYRTPKIYLEPLNISAVAFQYEDLLQVDPETSLELAKLTKGYSFAFQVLGHLLWDEPEHKVTRKVLAEFDQYMAEYVYEKIWSEMSKVEQSIVLAIPEDKIKTSDLLKKTGLEKNTYSVYRDRLIKKGILDSREHGSIQFALPRFYQYLRTVR